MRPHSTALRALATCISVALISALIACGGNSSGNGSTPPLPVISISISPAATTLSVGQTQNFTAAVQNATNTAVTWAVTEGTTGGSVTSAGAYTAPMTSGSYHVVATSQVDPTKSATAVVTVTAPSPSFTSNPPTAANEADIVTYTLAATDPANTGITFSLVSGPEGAQVNGHVLTWVPTHPQSRRANSFTVKATTGAGGSANQSFSVTPSGTIRGTAIDAYVTATGNVTASADLTGMYVAAVVLNDTGWTTVEGVAHSDGTFDIPGVPAGSYWFLTSGTAYWTSASDLDLGIDFMGRPDGVFPQNATFLDLNFTGLVPWQSNDRIELFNPNLNQSFNWTDFGNVGDVSAASLWQWTGPLSDGARGDAWYATQVRTKTVGGTSFSYLGKATPAMTITQTDGSTTPLAGGMTDVTQSAVRWNIAGTQFAAVAAVNPNVQLDSTAIGLYTQPFTATKGWIGYTQTLLERVEQQPITSDVDLGDVSYGNPFPSSWAPFFSVSYQGHVSYTAPGAATATDLPVEIYTSTTQMPSASKPLGPLVGAVRNVKLNGSDLSQPVTAATLTPVLSWDAPTVGTPTEYRVSVLRLFNGDSFSEYENVVDLFTNGTSLTIPDSVLASGEQYVFAIRSYYAPGVDFATAPYRLSFPWASADMLSAAVSTQGAAGTASSIRPASRLQMPFGRRAKAANLQVKRGKLPQVAVPRSRQGR